MVNNFQLFGSHFTAMKVAILTLALVALAVSVTYAQGPADREQFETVDIENFDNEITDVETENDSASQFTFSAIKPIVIIIALFVPVFSMGFYVFHLNKMSKKDV